MKSEALKKAEKMLSAAKLRKTGPRVTVLGVLIESPRPVRHEDITTMLGSKAPNKVTIYRVLESFLDAGLVHKAFLQDRVWHFELSHNCTSQQCHPHFTCKNCGQTHCLTKLSLPMVNGKNGFVIEHQRVLLEGLCPDCS